MTLGFEAAEELVDQPEAMSVYVPFVSASHGAITTDLPATGKAGDELSMSWTGGDPWIDSPTVVLERKQGDDWQTVSAGSVPVDQRNHRIALKMQPEPPWSKPAAVEFAQAVRTFNWSVVLRTGLRVKGALRALSGRYRLRIQGRALGQDGKTVDYTLNSGPVDVAD